MLTNVCPALTLAGISNAETTLHLVAIYLNCKCLLALVTSPWCSSVFIGSSFSFSFVGFSSFAYSVNISVSLCPWASSSTRFLWCWWNSSTLELQTLFICWWPSSLHLQQESLLSPSRGHHTHLDSVGPALPWEVNLIVVHAIGTHWYAGDLL